MTDSLFSAPLTVRYRKELHIVTKRYIVYLKNMNFSKSTITNAYNTLNTFDKRLKLRHRSIKPIKIHSITMQDIHDFRDHVSNLPIPKTSRRYGLGEKLCVNVVYAYISRLKMFFTYCRKLDINCLNPETIPVVKHEKSTISYLEIDEFKKLYAMPDKLEHREETRLRNKIIILLLYTTGLRLNELL